MHSCIVCSVYVVLRLFCEYSFAFVLVFNAFVVPELDAFNLDYFFDWAFYGSICTSV